jgi:hypothetical protein
MGDADQIADRVRAMLQHQPCELREHPRGQPGLGE